MAFYFATSFALLVLISCCSGHVDLHEQPISDQGISLLDDCVPGEYTCSADCFQVLFCSSGGPVVVDTCSAAAGTVCSTVTHQCVVGTTCEHPAEHGPINCNALGFFPDPVFCEDYHLCTAIGSKSELQTCPTPSAYNPLTTLCTLNQSSRVCLEGPIPKCKAPGDVGPQEENPNIYYICVNTGTTLTPELYKCPSDEIFVVDKCVAGLWSMLRRYMEVRYDIDSLKTSKESSAE